MIGGRLTNFSLLLLSEQARQTDDKLKFFGLPDAIGIRPRYREGRQSLTRAKEIWNTKMRYSSATLTSTMNLLPKDTTAG